MRYVTSTPNHQLPIPNHSQRPTPNLQGRSAFKVAAQDRGVGINAAIAEERPVAADLFNQRGVALRNQDLLALARLGHIAAERISDERVAEEGDAVGAGLVFVADAVWRRNVYAVRDRMRPLHRPPGIDLRLAPFLLLGGMPANGRGVEEHLRAEQRRDARGFGVPLVPADQHADNGVARLPHLEPAGASDAIIVFARREVVLLVEQRVVGDVHLAIHAHERAVRVDDGGRIAIDTRSLPLEDGYDDHHFQLARELLHRVGAWTGNRFGQVEAVAFLR